MIIGSANINDRSLMGDRDSEIGLCISDSEMVETVFNGQPYSVAKFAHTFRCSLFQEHLGLSANSGVAEDPVCEDSWALWQQRSHLNTDVYRSIFPGISSWRWSFWLGGWLWQGLASYTYRSHPQEFLMSGSAR